jgi:hypothetical protein
MTVPFAFIYLITSLHYRQASIWSIAFQFEAASERGIGMPLLQCESRYSTGP